MDFSTGEKTTAQIIRAIIGLKESSIAAVAKELNTSRQNITNKLKRNNFSEAELKQIGDILGYDVTITFTERKQ